MKRIASIVIICSFLLTSFGIVPGLADPEVPPSIYLPFVALSPSTFTVSGTIRDVDQYPVPNVTVADKNGITAVTDLDGNYTLNLAPGPNWLTVSRSGFLFTPAQLDINVFTNLSGVDFAALVGCGNIIINGALDFGMGGWDFPSAGPSGIATGGTDATVSHSALRSGRTGIPPTAGFNVLSNSTAKSQVYHLPSDADTVNLGLWIYQLSSSLVGENDHQYVQILDKNDNVLSTLFWQNANTGAWTYVEFPLNTSIGDSIVIQVATFNDGAGGTSAMYFDDVALTVCNEDGECNQIKNGGFEVVSDWFYIAPQVVPPTYSATFFHTGAVSMQTGIPVGDPNQTSFSEVFQDFRIPRNVSRASLSFWLYTTSGVTAAELEGAGPLDMESLDIPAAPEIPAIPIIDQQYAYILDEDGNVNRILFKMYASNTNAWVQYTFDLRAYIGDNLTLKFGTYNDGIGGNTAMWIDDVILDTCDD
jgi:hypothetical protein